MLITRRIGYILRGKATPFQLFTGCLLGAILGFLPGFAAAPGLMVTTTLLLVLLNANLVLAALVGLVARLLSLALLPVAFALGRALLDGPLSGLFGWLINAPVLALFGFENYTATGGLVLGLLVGTAAGRGVVALVTGFRRAMADGNSTGAARYQALMQRTWFKAAVVVLAGGGLKDPDYAALLKTKVGNPIRPLGGAAVVLFLVLVVIGYQFLSPTILTTALRSGLERAHGATVELDNTAVDLAAGRMTLSGLAMADPENLGADLFRASLVEADISGVNLLRKRLQFDRIEITGATSGEARRVPGRRLPSAPRTTPTIALPDLASLEDYLANAQVWKDRLAQIKAWLDRLHGTAPAEEGVEAEESLGDRLAREAEARGYRRVTARHLVTGAPTLLITTLHAGEVRVSQLPGETLDIVGSHLSTQPHLVAETPSLRVTSSRDTLGFAAELGAAAATRGASTLAFHYRGLAVDEVVGMLKSDGGTPPLAGGTLDLRGSGRYGPAEGTIDLPLTLTLHDTTVRVAGRDTRVSQFDLPVGVTGPLDAPRLKIDAADLTRLVGAAGRTLIEDRAKEALGDRAGKLLHGLGGK